MNSERRRLPRISSRIVVSCSKNGEGFKQREHFLSYSKNLSAAGTCLVSSREVPVGERISIVLELPTNFIPLMIYGDVIWVKDVSPVPDQEPKKIEIGIRFSKVSQADADKLLYYLSVKEIQEKQLTLSRAGA